MGKVTQLKPQEAVNLDFDILGELYSEMGHFEAEEAVCKAMEELALRMAQCDRHFRSGNFDELRKSARSLVSVSRPIGLHMVAKVAMDVVTTVEQEDPVALAATMTRLMHAGEQSLTAIWKLQGQTV